MINGPYAKKFTNDVKEGFPTYNLQLHVQRRMVIINLWLIGH